MQSNDARKYISENINRDRLFFIRLDLIICVFLALITVAVYWQVRHHEFIDLDDDLYVTNNRHVQSGLTVKSLLWSFSFSDKGKTYWHPLTWLSHILDCQLYGLNPGMHHLTNVILHMANCVLLFWVFKRMTGEIWKGAFVAALFALHPVNVDSVAWVAERKNLLSTFFWMLTLLSYAYYSERPVPYRYLLALFAFALGLLAKPMLVTLPFVLLLLDYWPLGRLHHPTIPSAFRLIMEKIPFFILSAISIYLSTLSLESYGNMISLEQVSMKLRIFNALVSYVSYIGKMIWPYNLAIVYPYPSSIPFWKAACSGLFLIFSSLAVVWAVRQRPYFAVGWFWFLGMLIPVIGLVQAGLWPAMADRWAYIPVIGLFVMIAWGIPELSSRWRYKKIGLAIIGAIILSVLTGTTLIQLRYWNNSITLFEHALHLTTNNFVLHYNLGVILAEQGKDAEAISHFSEAIRIKSAYYKAYNNLGFVLLKQGKITEAVRPLYVAVRIKPDFALAREGRIQRA